MPRGEGVARHTTHEAKTERRALKEKESHYYVHATPVVKPTASPCLVSFLCRLMVAVPAFRASNAGWGHVHPIGHQTAAVRAPPRVLHRLLDPGAVRVEWAVTA